MSHQEVVVEVVYYAIQGTLLMGIFAISFLLFFYGWKLAVWLSRKIGG